MKTNTKISLLIQPPLYLLIKDITPQELVKFYKKSNAPKGSLYYYFPQGKEQTCSRSFAKKLLKKNFLQKF